MTQLHPRVAVLSFGADDAHDYMTGAPRGASVGPIGSAIWGREYRRRVSGVTNELNRAGIYVVWLGVPISRSPLAMSGSGSSTTSSRLSLTPNPPAPPTSTPIRSSPGAASTATTCVTRGQLVLMRASDGSTTRSLPAISSQPP